MDLKRVLADFSSDEIELVHWLAEECRQGRPYIDVDKVQERFNWKRGEAWDKLKKLGMYGILQSCNQSSVMSGLVTIQASEAIKNPPPPDHWKDVTVWFKSKPWSVPFLVAIVAIPILWQWVEIGVKIGSWVWPGMSDKPPAVAPQVPIGEDRPGIPIEGSPESPEKPEND